ncbi:hypothetical protein N219_00240 [Limosilactobacillus fermentum MTCC 8711]|nr:hypothetical protein N219_00240 [Limosilactobacillus fermentum MTCC 8711]
MTAVTVAGLMVVVIWLVALKKRPAYPQALQEGWQSYIRQGMLSGAKLAPFFIAIGYFSNAFDGSPVALALSKVVGPNLSHLSLGVIIRDPGGNCALGALGNSPASFNYPAGASSIDEPSNDPNLGDCVSLERGWGTVLPGLTIRRGDCFN